MDNKNTQKPKKKSSGGFVGLIVLLVVWALNRVDFSRLFARLRWMLQTGRFPENSETLGAVAAGAVLLIVLIAVLARAVKSAKARRFDGVPSARRGGTAAHHSHDRLQGYSGDENSVEHWKKQLDGFLAAGIIDRSEYRTLLERRSVSYSKK